MIEGWGGGRARNVGSDILSMYNNTVNYRHEAANYLLITSVQTSDLIISGNYREKNPCASKTSPTSCIITTRVVGKVT